jgi:hypothetical protein
MKNTAGKTTTKHSTEEALQVQQDMIHMINRGYTLAVIKAFLVRRAA